MRLTKHLVVHTTMDIASLEVLDSVIDCIESVLKGKKFDRHEGLEVEGRLFGLSELASGDKQFGSQHLRFRILGEPFPRMSMRINCLQENEATRYIRANGLVQNDVRISFTDGELAQDDFFDQLENLAVELNGIMKSTLSYLADSRFDDISYDTKSGLETGLRDIYCLMIFGDAYQAMPGFLRSRDFQYSTVKTLDSGHKLLRANTNCGAVQNEKWSRLKDKIKSEIGTEYFCDLSKLKMQESGVFSPWQAIKSVFSRNKEFLNEPHTSKIVPQFDYSQIYSQKRPRF